MDEESYLTRDDVYAGSKMLEIVDHRPLSRLVPNTSSSRQKINTYQYINSDYLSGDAPPPNKSATQFAEEVVRAISKPRPFNGARYKSHSTAMPWDHDSGKLFSTKKEGLKAKINMLRRELGIVPLDVDTRMTYARSTSTYKPKYQLVVDEQSRQLLRAKLNKLMMKYDVQAREEEFRLRFERWMEGIGKDEEYTRCFWIPDDKKNATSKTELTYRERENRALPFRAEALERHEQFTMMWNAFLHRLERTKPKNQHEAYLFYKYVVLQQKIDPADRMLNAPEGWESNKMTRSDPFADEMKNLPGDDSLKSGVDSWPELEPAEEEKPPQKDKADKSPAPAAEDSAVKDEQPVSRDERAVKTEADLEKARADYDALKDDVLAREQQRGDALEGEVAGMRAKLEEQSQRVKQLETAAAQAQVARQIPDAVPVPSNVVSAAALVAPIEQLVSSVNALSARIDSQNATASAPAPVSVTVSLSDEQLQRIAQPVVSAVEKLHQRRDGDGNPPAGALNVELVQTVISEVMKQMSPYNKETPATVRTIVQSNDQSVIVKAMRQVVEQNQKAMKASQDAVENAQRTMSRTADTLDAMFGAQGSTTRVMKDVGKQLMAINSDRLSVSQQLQSMTMALKENQKSVSVVFDDTALRSVVSEALEAQHNQNVAQIESLEKALVVRQAQQATLALQRQENAIAVQDPLSKMQVMIEKFGEIMTGKLVEKAAEDGQNALAQSLAKEFSAALAKRDQKYAAVKDVAPNLMIEHLTKEQQRIAVEAAAQLQDLQNKNSELQKQVKQQKQVSERQQQALQQTNKHVQVVQNQLIEREQALAVLQQQSGASAFQTKELQDEKNRLEAQVDGLKQKLENTDGTAVAVYEDLGKTQKQLEDTQQKLRLLGNNYGSLNDQLLLANQELADTRLALRQQQKLAIEASQAAQLAIEQQQRLQLTYDQGQQTENSVGRQLLAMEAQAQINSETDVGASVKRSRTVRVPGRFRATGDEESQAFYNRLEAVLNGPPTMPSSIEEPTEEETGVVTVAQQTVQRAIQSSDNAELQLHLKAGAVLKQALLLTDGSLADAKRASNELANYERSAYIVHEGLGPLQLRLEAANFMEKQHSTAVTVDYNQLKSAVENSVNRSDKELLMMRMYKATGSSNKSVELYVNRVAAIETEINQVMQKAEQAYANNDHMTHVQLLRQAVELAGRRAELRDSVDADEMERLSGLGVEISNLANEAARDVASDDIDVQNRGHAAFKRAAVELAALRSNFEKVNFGNESGVQEIVESEETVGANFGALVMRGVNALVPENVNREIVDEVANSMESILRGEEKDPAMNDDDDNNDDDDDSYNPGQPGVDTSASLPREVFLAELQATLIEMSIFMQEFRNKYPEGNMQEMHGYVISRMSGEKYTPARKIKPGKASVHNLTRAVLKQRENGVFRPAVAATA